MMEDKLISSNELRKIVSRMVELPSEMRAQMMGAINRAGEAVVRCKDCKHYEEGPYNNGDRVCYRWDEWLFPNDDYFCSLGERKDNG